jgi:GTPase SAR1 family protein
MSDNFRKILIPFRLPSNFFLVGDSGSGKTWLIKLLVKYKNEMFSPPPDKILLLYQKYQDIYDEMLAEYDWLTVAPGLNKQAIEGEQAKQLPNGTLVIIDDQMSVVATSPFFENLCTSGRHYGISGVITVLHNLFPSGKNARTIALNSNCYIMMRSPRIASSLPALGRQFGKSKEFKEAYDLATSGRPYSYLV